MKRMRTAIRTGLPPAWMAALFAASSVPGGIDGAGDAQALSPFAWIAPAAQNLLHVPAFGVLAWLWFRALSTRCSPRATLVGGAGLTIAYAILDEWHQAHVPGRFSSMTDLLADSLGAFLAAGLYAAMQARARR